MIETMVGWLAVAFVLWGMGYALAAPAGRLTGIKIQNNFAILLCGIVAATLYAELVSLFLPLRGIAFGGAFGIALIAFVFALRKGKLPFGKAEALPDRRLKVLRIVLFLCLLFFAALAASFPPMDWDSYNYHAASIRWMEEYGVVKGLGNLHSRLAYNSAFLCLQALFSFVWATGRSAHSLNGFFWLFFSWRALSTLGVWKKKKAGTADLLKCLFLFLLFRYEQLYRLSSPQTDFLPFCLCAEIFIDTIEAAGEEKRDPKELLYGFLAVFTLSVKLSAAAIALFILPPFFAMLRQKQIKQLLLSGAGALFLILPHVLRNVFLSGYLFYPVTVTALGTDWQIPVYTAHTDALAVKLFARVGNDWDYGDIQKGIGEWFPLWLKAEGRLPAAMALCGLFCALLLCFLLIIRFLRYPKRRRELYPQFVSLCGIVFLLLSAPSLRFGIWWFLLPAAFVAELPLAWFSKKGETGILLGKALAVGMLLLAVWEGGRFFVLQIPVQESGASLLLQAQDYADEKATAAWLDMDGYRFYYLNPDPQGEHAPNGYRGFPGSECLDTLEKIRLRGKELSDGFCVKEEYRDLPYDFQGRTGNLP